MRRTKDYLRGIASTAGSGWIWTWLFLAALCLSATNAPSPAYQPLPAGQQEPEKNAVTDGLFITVHNPITSSVVNRVKTKTNRFLDRPNHQGLTIVYDFNPDGHASGSGDYGPCRDLAEFLLSLQDITTVAFVHNEVTRHSVLPVLACKEVVMSADAKLGDALRDQKRPLQEDEAVFYRRVAERRGRPTAIVLKMADKDISVVESTRNGAVWYVDARELPKGGAAGEVILPAGSAGLYSTAQAQKFGLCGLKKESRQEVIEAYRLPIRALHEDPLEGRTPIASRVVVRGAVTPALAETIKRRIRSAVARGVNLIVLQLECGGGDTQVARDLADFLHSLKDDAGKNPVMTIAYVTDQSRDTAAFLAFGCSEIVMSSKARLGDFENVVAQRPKYQEAIRKSLEDLLREQGYDVVLATAMLDPKVALHRVRSQKGQVEHRLMTAEELRKDREGEQRWIDAGQEKPPGVWFQMNAEQAKDMGVVRFVVQGAPAEALNELYSHYGLENVQDSRLDWLDELAQFLRHPLMSLFLVMVGITGLILEIKLPGVGLPGVIAAICFVLFFWAHSQLAGHLTMLAVLLFLLGLILIGLEIFVVPGFGVTGISGTALVVVSLGLATLVKKPVTTQEWFDFGTTLTQFAVCLVAAVVLAFVVAYYLPSIPYANRLVLAPPPGGGEVLEEGVPAPALFGASLLGAIGEAATTLRPAGKARFGDDYLDVVAEGSFVEAGARIQVVEIEGNRVVVKEI